MIVAIAGGPGGAGRTEVAAVLARAAGALGRRVAAVDAAEGEGPLGMLLGLDPEDARERMAAWAQAVADGPVSNAGIIAADAQQAAVTELAQGGLRLGNEVPNPTQAGDWYVGTYCSSFGQAGGTAVVQVQYAVLNLFPEFGSLEGGTGEAGAWSLDQVASFPTE